MASGGVYWYHTGEQWGVLLFATIFAIAVIPVRNAIGRGVDLTIRRAEGGDRAWAGYIYGGAIALGLVLIGILVAASLAGTVANGKIWQGGALGVALVPFGLIGLRRVGQAKKVAAAMATSGNSPADEAVAAAISARTTKAPGIDVKMIASAMLDPAIGHDDLAPDRNAAGRAPISILYLYNFYSELALARKDAGGWQRYGTVFHLGSPNDIATKHLFAHDISTIARAKLVAGPADFDARFAAASCDFLAPGDDELDGYAKVTGGWPRHTFLCTDASWQHGVERLYAAVDVVIIDASDYAPARSGLNWEIQKIVDHVDADRLLVLSDTDADLVALRNSFQAAWHMMAAGSPNDREDSGSIRIIVYPRDDRIRAAEDRAFADRFSGDATGGLRVSDGSMRLYAAEQDRLMSLLFQDL